MKTNLENKPTFEDDEEVQHTEKRDIIETYNLWFRDFEAELRAEIAFADRSRPEGIAVIMKLKEILGEKT